MHQHKKYVLILAIIAISGYSNCWDVDPLGKMAMLSEQQEAIVTPNPLELHGDSVKFNLSVELPKKMLRQSKKSWYKAEVFYTTGDVTKMQLGFRSKNREIKAGDIYFDGYPYATSYKRPILDTNMQFAYHDSLQYGYLIYYGIIGKATKSKKIGPIKVRGNKGAVVGIATTCRLVKTPKSEDSKEGNSAYEAIKSATSRNDGQYKKAYELLANAPKTFTNQFNQGLAYLLEGKNYEKAKKALEAATQLNEQDAIAHYVLGIVASRTENDQELTKYLKKAFALKPNLKGKALKDAEFFKYLGKEPFIEALK